MSPADSSPTVSVLMACYNGQRWLAEAMTSVLGQTFSDFEFIVVDDGSTDASSRIIDEYSRSDPRIVVISKTNTGLADSLNTGIRRARGPWIARLDADDICEPNRLEVQVAKARSQSDLVFIGSGFRLIDEVGGMGATLGYPSQHDRLVHSLRTAGRFPPHSSAFYRADAVASLGGYRARIRRAEDWDLWLRLSSIGRITAIDAPLVRIRKHADQISNEQLGRSQILDSRMAIISYWLGRQNEPDPVAGNDEDFALFRDWVLQRLERERLFDLKQYSNRVKENLAESKGSPTTTARAIAAAVSTPRLFIKYLQARFIGESVSKRLAVEWAEGIKQGV